MCVRDVVSDITGQHPRVAPAIYINPDSYLETVAGRVFTAARNKAAWAKALTDLAVALTGKIAPKLLYVVVGVQGAGKTTWVRANRTRLEGSVVFDAALPTKAHRLKVLSIAKKAKCPAIAVWINVPLDLALARNQLRLPDKRVPEPAIRSVFSQFERPSADEGFTRVLVIGAA